MALSFHSGRDGKDSKTIIPKSLKVKQGEDSDNIQHALNQYSFAVHLKSSSLADEIQTVQKKTNCYTFTHTHTHPWKLLV